MNDVPGPAPARALCRFTAADGHVRLGAVYGDRVVDLTARGELPGGLISLLHEPPGTLEAVLGRHAGAPADYSYTALDRAPGRDAAYLLTPMEPEQEVWAAGVTYTRSRQARMEETTAAADVYARVYDAERPELFFKATAGRVAGLNTPMAVRSDATWTVPEPELTLLLGPDLACLGYTIGDDLTARDIEAQNPLYLPQAKVYERCCALGPVVVPAGDLDPYALDIHCAIERDGRELFSAGTSTSLLHRRLEELAAYLGRHNRFAHGVFLMTGTGIVPPDDVALRPGDVITITITGLGTLRNAVTS